jgi:hypothetical protein
MTNPPPTRFIAPGLSDDRFALPTQGKDGALTTLAPGFPRVASTRSAEHMEGVAVRNPVVPTLMSHMKEACIKLHTPNPAMPHDRAKNRTLLLLGAPGVGKTTLPQVVAEMIGCEHIMINCHDREISELISATTVDGHHKWAALEQTINDKLRDKSLKPVSTKVIGEHFKEFMANDGTIDFGKLSDAADDGKATTRMEALQKVAEHEGIISRAGAHLISKVPGELYHALKRAKESQLPVIITLDEFPRRRDASGGNPQLYEVLAGTRSDAIRIEGGNGESFTLSNEDLRRSNSIVVFTGNYRDPKDPSLKPMPAALISRIGAEGIADLGVRDWATRIQQLIAGVPVSMHYDTQSDRWEGKGDYAGETHDFGDFVQTARTHGMDEASKSAVPAHQLSFLQNWSNFKQGSEQLAAFFHDFAQMENAKSALYDANKITNSPLLGAMQDEVRRRPSNHPAIELAVDPRLPQRWIEEAMQPEVPVTPKGKKPKAIPDVPGDPEAEFGTRMVRVIQRHIDQLYPEGNPHSQNCRNYVQGLMAKHGIFEPKQKPVLDKQTTDALKTVDVITTGDVSSVATLLNTPREQGKDATVKAWQKILARYITSTYPEHFEANAPIKPEQVVSYNSVKAALEHAAEQPNLPAVLQDQLELIDAVAPTSGARESQFGIGFTPHLVTSDDTEAASWRERTQKGGVQQADAAMQRLLMSLALPGARVSETLTGLFMPSTGDENTAMLADKLAAGEPNPANLGITNFRVGVDKNGVPQTAQLLVRFGAPPAEGAARTIERAVIIGDSPILSPEMDDMLGKANVVYINRQAPEARAQISSTIQELVTSGVYSSKATAKAAAEKLPVLEKIKDAEQKKTRIESETERHTLKPQEIEAALKSALLYTADMSPTFIKSTAGRTKAVQEAVDVAGDDEDMLRLMSSSAITKSDLSLGDIVSNKGNLVATNSQMLVATASASLPARR